MYYKKLTHAELSEYKYPNLIAELIESHYSICTVAEHMGMGRRSETDLEVWDKLTGKTEILASECAALSGLFHAPMRYLFSHEIRVIQGETAAFYRYLDSNCRMQEEMERSQMVKEIVRKFKENPHLLKLYKVILTWDDKQLQEFIDLVEKKIP